MWRNHLYTCIALVIMAVPVFMFDRSMKPGGGEWISLDFRGLLITTYILVAIAHIAISTCFLAIMGRGLILIHLISFVVSVALVVGGWLAYSNHMDNRQRRHHDARLESRRKLINAIELKAWAFAPGEKSPERIVTRVKVAESGRFAGNVTAFSHDEHDIPTLFFDSRDTEQLQIEAGAEFEFVFPLTVRHEGIPDDISITFYLFKDSTGSASQDIRKVYKKEISTEDDGHYFYGVLPPPEVQ